MNRLFTVFFYYNIVATTADADCTKSKCTAEVDVIVFLLLEPVDVYCVGFAAASYVKPAAQIPVF